MWMRRKRMNSITPAERGLYLARYESHKWYNLIVEICGEAPFLTWKAWDRINNRIIILDGIPNFIFGPKIDETIIEGDETK